MGKNVRYALSVAISTAVLACVGEDPATGTGQDDAGGQPPPAMGVVWRARDTRLQRAVAVKLLTAAAVGSEIARARLIREAHAAAALEHDGIVRVYDDGETDDGGAYLVMELIRGMSLRDAMERESLILARRIAVIADAARALRDLGAAPSGGARWE